MVEGDGSYGGFNAPGLTGITAVPCEMRLDSGCFSTLKAGVRGCEKLLRSGSEDFDGFTWIEGDAFHGVVLFPVDREGTILQVDGSLAGDVVGMDGDVGLVAAVLHPVHRAMMMPVGARDPCVTMPPVNPGAAMADRPVIPCSAEVIIGSNDALLAGDGVALDETADSAGRARKRILIFGAENSAWNCGLIAL